MDLGNKLVHQWKCHGALLIAFDFDDTVFDLDPTFGSILATKMLRELLRKAKKQGHTLICYTCRDRFDKPVHEFLMEKEIFPNYINESPVQSDGKIFYNILLDDKSGLREAIDALEYALQEIEKIKLQEAE